MDSDFMDPILLQPFRRPVVFHDCCLELYSATCLTATRLNQLGLPWPSTSEEIMVILHTTPSPLTRQYLGRGMASVAVANMVRAAAAAQKRFVPATQPEELLAEVLCLDQLAASEAADALAMVRSGWRMSGRVLSGPVLTLPPLPPPTHDCRTW